MASVSAVPVIPARRSYILKKFWMVIVAIVCDRGDRYLSTGVFNAEGNAEAGQ